MIEAMNAELERQNSQAEKPELWNQGFMIGWISAINHIREAIGLAGKRE